MSTEGKQLVESFIASGDLTTMQYRVVDLLADKRVGHAAANLGFGVLINKPRTTEHASVVTRGGVKLRAGAAITVGSYVAVSGSGWVTATTGATTAIASGAVLTPRVLLGKAFTACASGSLFECDFDPQATLVVSA